jgi:HSP20 family protein
MAIFFDRDPFLELERLQRQMDRLFQDLTGREFYPRRVGVYPLVNISEDHDHIYVRAELPGVNPEDLEITMKDQQLVLRGERKIPP